MTPWYWGTLLLQDKIPEKEFPFKFYSSGNEIIDLKGKILMDNGMYLYMVKKIFSRIGEKDYIIKSFDIGYLNMSEFYAHINNFFYTYKNRWIMPQIYSDDFIQKTKFAAKLCKQNLYTFSKNEPRSHNDETDKIFTKIKEELNKNTKNRQIL